MHLFQLASDNICLATCMFVKKAATCGRNISKEYYNCKIRLNHPDVCIYCGSEDDELVLDTEPSSKGERLRPQYQYCVESGKPTVVYGKCDFDEGTGRNVYQRGIGGVGDRNGEDERGSNINDDKEEENNHDENDNDNDNDDDDDDNEGG
jgi:hypothetical protein